MALVLVLALVLGAAVGAANHWLLTMRLGVDAAAAPELFWALVGAPVVLAIVVALVAGTRRGATGATAASEPSQSGPPPEHGALRLLALLQEEGRLIDFLSESIVAYSDAQIGAATRDIHDGCAKALRAAVDLVPVIAGEEDSEVTIDEGFDPATIRLTGNVSGTPPFRGVLRHAGWRVSSVRLPERAGVDPIIVAPAEVEIP